MQCLCNVRIKTKTNIFIISSQRHNNFEQGFKERVQWCIQIPVKYLSRSFFAKIVYVLKPKIIFTKKLHLNTPLVFNLLFSLLGSFFVKRNYRSGIYGFIIKALWIHIERTKKVFFPPIQMHKLSFTCQRGDRSIFSFRLVLVVDCVNEKRSNGTKKNNKNIKSKNKLHNIKHY